MMIKDDIYGKKILLTGATGFLGSHVLYQLLESGAIVYCLVRANDSIEGHQRIDNTLKNYNTIIPNDCKGKLVTICGDITSKRLGLSRIDYNMLTDNLFTVINCAALVNFVLPYSELEETNVIGVQNLIDLCLSLDIRLVHVSSSAIFLSSFYSPGQSIDCDSPPPPIKYSTGNYSKSKLVAEHLINDNVKQGLKCTVLRPGLICGSTITGACYDTSYHWLLAKSCLQIGNAPSSKEIFETVSVDFVSEIIIISLSLPDDFSRYTIPSTNQHKWNDFCSEVSSHYQPISFSPIHVWRKNMLDNPYIEGERNAFLPFFRWLRNSEVNQLFGNQNSNFPNISYDKKHPLHLEKLKQQRENSIGKVVDFFQEKGFFEVQYEY
ncbi:hypothetical protein VCRA2133E348_250004 [Vibrio crassostreae]|nr:hypothetical protein VCRA2119O48_220004 [Vibrio crassostreae]CAK2803225.1 hypothetical protein VCRA2133E348_250004 [Vibrio crassostreae]CAK3292925.1 hypothetical protein VCRA213O314_240090 [Vibrio crassostreae]CAK3846600.1 hypothetical protein VCRA212O16_230004 [Vibrio crassostreae]